MPDAMEPSTVIARDTTIKGEVVFRSPACVLGRVEGQIHAENALAIGAEAAVVGDITAETVDIQGTVEGNVTAQQGVRLGATARLQGELRSANLAISEGATFVGKVVVGVDNMAQASQPAAAPAAPVLAPVIVTASATPAPGATDEGEAAPREPMIRVMTQTLQQAAAANRNGRVIKVH